MASVLPARKRGDDARVERALIAHEDDLIIGLAELTKLERQVFALLADGRSWRAIATALGLPEREARNTTRACEQKRNRFLALYSSGRLCGYRSHTIGKLLAGEQSGELAVAQALAHLRHCRVCRHQHHTDSARLRSMFDALALALLPIPTLPHTQMGLLERLGELAGRPFRAAHRLSVPPTGMRERVIEAAAASGATAKIAAGAIGVVMLAGTTISATHVFDQHQHKHHGHRSAIIRPTYAVTRIPVRQPPRAVKPHAARYQPDTQHVRGAFGYLGVPSAPKRSQTPIVMQRGGGPFGP